MNARTASAALYMVLFLAPWSAGAGNFSYTYIEGGYGQVDIDNPNIDGDVWGIGGSYGITEWVHVYANYAYTDYDDFGADGNNWGAGLGVSVPLGDKADFVGEAGYVYADIDTRFGDADDDGYALSVALRGQLADQFQLEGGVTYADLDDTGDDTTFFAGGRFYFTESFAAGAGYSAGDDVSAWSLTLRWEFPK